MLLLERRGGSQSTHHPLSQSAWSALLLPDPGGGILET